VKGLWHQAFQNIQRLAGFTEAILPSERGARGAQPDGDNKFGGDNVLQDRIYDLLVNLGNIKWNIQGSDSGKMRSAAVIAVLREIDGILNVLFWALTTGHPDHLPRRFGI
jgi:hypothetical protein